MILIKNEKVLTSEGKILKVNGGGGTGSSEAKLVASYTYTLEDDSTNYGLNEYFTYETDTLTPKANTLYLVEIKFPGFFPSSTSVIGKFIKSGGSYSFLSPQTFFLPPSQYNENKYNWVNCCIGYDTYDNCTRGNLTISTIGHEFDYNSIGHATINNFTIKFYELPITLGGNE